MMYFSIFFVDIKIKLYSSFVGRLENQKLVLLAYFV